MPSLKNSMPQMRDLPPLKALRVFEACYRLRSYTGAGPRLNVGQPAISHQIRQLEADLGVTLFVRKGSAVAATPEADLLYEETAPALTQIAAASRRLRRRAAAREVALATYPGVAAYWASPRLARLREAGAGFCVRMITAERDADIVLDDADCAILFGRGDWPGCDRVALVPERVAPIAAPRLAARLTGVTPARVLAEGPLIHLDDPERHWFDWKDWHDRFAPEVEDLNRAAVVTNHGLAIHQALQGHGVTLGWTGIIVDLLHGGRLSAARERAVLRPGMWPRSSI
jgi:LysR family transcriptional regulator, glycine cleavage system transcriptional activator